MAFGHYVKSIDQSSEYSNAIDKCFLRNEYHYVKSTDQSSEYSNAMDILIMCKELVSGDHVGAMYMYADILSATDPIANPIYHRIYLAYEKLLVNNQLYSADFPKPIDFYMGAAYRGELRAAEKLAAHYLKIGNYEEMTWWFWWAVKYNDKESKRNNPTIFYKIKGDNALCSYFENMSIESRNRKKNTYHTRMHDHLRKEDFLCELVKHIAEFKKKKSGKRS